MGMFTELYPLATSTHLAMLVSADAGHGVMTVSVMPRPAKGSPSSPSRDLTLTATPEELDTGFAAALASYTPKLVPLLEQVDAAAKALEAAQGAGQKHAKPGTKTSAKAKHSPTVDVPRHAAVPETGDSENPNEDPDRNWMKNRQPELF